MCVNFSFSLVLTAYVELDFILMPAEVHIVVELHQLSEKI